MVKNKIDKITIIGTDIGNEEVQTSEMVTFHSKVKIGTKAINKNDIKVEYNKMKYTIGEGNNNIGLNKYKNTNYKVTLLTAIAKSIKSNKIECNLVVGVPVEIFNKNKEIVDDLKETIKSWGQQTIIVNEEVKIIDIQDVEVFCESGIVFSDRERFENEKTLVVDLGGGTLDISLWNGLDLVDCKSNDKMGMINLYKSILEEVNNTYKCNLNYEDAKAMIGKEEYKINREIQDISFVDAIVENFVIGLASDLNQLFPFSNCDSVQLIGGGAIALKEYFIDKKMIEKAEVNKDANFLNAKTYKKVGELIWC